jgi:hypothetical protein
VVRALRMIWRSVAVWVAPRDFASSSAALKEFRSGRSPRSQLPFTPKSQLLQVLEGQTRLAPVPVINRAAL